MTCVLHCPMIFMLLFLAVPLPQKTCISDLWHFPLVGLERPPKSWSECSYFTNPNLPVESIIYCLKFECTSHQLTSTQYVSTETNVAVPQRAELMHASRVNYAWIHSLAAEQVRAIRHEASWSKTASGKREPTPGQAVQYGFAATDRPVKNTITLDGMHPWQLASKSPVCKQLAYLFPMFHLSF